MSETDFDTALVTAAFRIAGEQGWSQVTAAEAAREAGISVVEARERFPSPAAILLRFGRLADQAALAGATLDGTVRDRLFDLLMRRFDALQPHRAGIKALMRVLPVHPPTAMLLASSTSRSMRWMLQGAGLAATGLCGHVQVRGLQAVWLWGLRAWERDESEDLTGTMAAVDTALQRAERFASWLEGQRTAPAPPPPPPVSAGAGELDPSAPPLLQSPIDDVPGSAPQPLDPPLDPPSLDPSA
jgi:ubiquinone biosynthesis protein COQ9